MRKLANFIVDKRKFFVIIFIVLIVASAFTMSLTEVNYDVTKFLPPETDTRRGYEIMKTEFKNNSMAKVMVKNITYDNAIKLYDELKELDCLTMVTFDDSAEHYKDANALFDIVLDAEMGSVELETDMPRMRAVFEGYDIATIAEAVTKETNDALMADMMFILILAVGVTIASLITTSRSYAEILVFPIIFGVAALINLGTHFIVGEISFITNAISPLLQLALAVDYAIIFCHLFTDELEKYDAVEACKRALTKAIPEIASSSLTTIAGMVALMFMQLRLGRDVGIVMSKGIIISLLTVFFLMPAVLIAFSKSIKKTRHKRFLPDIKKFSQIVVKLKFVVPAIFIVVVAFFGVMQGNAKYAYSNNAVDTDVLAQEKIDMLAIEETFGQNSTLAILLPKTNYVTERKILNEIAEKPLVKSVTGIANIKLDEDTYLSDSVNVKDFSRILNLDSQSARALFVAYGLMQEDYQVLTNIDEYKVPLVDILFFLVEQTENGTLPLEGEQAKMLEEMGGLFKDMKSQLIGENYNRAMFIVGSGVETDETFELIREIQNDLKKYYGNGAILVGEATNSFEMNESFSTDTLLITLITIVLIGAILIFTFKSFLIPIFLILIIQGSVWINFGIPALMGDKMYFFAYLLGSAIQMGATIDYAIVITSRFNALKTTHGLKESAQLALQESFPTVATSGSIMIFATLLLGLLSKDPMIGSVGLCLSRGSLVSVLAVMIVLPQFLIIGDKWNEKTRFSLEEKKRTKRTIRLTQGGTKLNGKFDGYIDGVFQGKLKGVLFSKEDMEMTEVESQGMGRDEEDYNNDVKYKKKEVDDRESDEKKQSENKGEAK